MCVCVCENCPIFASIFFVFFSFSFHPRTNKLKANARVLGLIPFYIQIEPVPYRTVDNGYCEYTLFTTQKKEMMMISLLNKMLSVKHTTAAAAAAAISSYIQHDVWKESSVKIKSAVKYKQNHLIEFK